MQIFGFEIARKKQAPQITVVGPSNDDGSMVVNSAAGYYAQVINLEAAIKSENDLIRRYREVAQYPDCDGAIEDIVNEAIIADEDQPPIKIVLDDVKISASIKKKIEDEFQNVFKLLKFKNKGHDIFRNWYIDGRLYYQILVDETNPKGGIVELRQVDPRKIRKIKNVEKQKNENGVEIVTKIDEYYIYNDKGITEANINGVRLPLDSVIYTGSGLIDSNTGLMLSHLHKAIKIVNQLKMMEDALVIYRISRAPERRIFYVDVGNLPKLKAEQYVNDLMNKFKNKIVYDATTGEIRDDRKQLSMMEDFWMPRRDGKSTEITTLPGAQNISQLDDLEYFRKKLQQALNVPNSRTKEETGFTLGQSQTITRDELKFSKYVGKLRLKFGSFFTDLLKVQLVAKGIISLQDWEEIKLKIKYDFIQDNHFTELKNIEILQSKLGTLQLVDQYSGKYFSKAWIQRKVLFMSDEEIDEIADEIEEEGAAANPVVPGMPTVDSDGQPVDQYAQQMQQQQMQQDMQDQQMQQDQEAHEQDMEQSDELRQERLKQTKNNAKGNQSWPGM